MQKCIFSVYTLIVCTWYICYFRFMMVANWVTLSHALPNLRIWIWTWSWIRIRIRILIVINSNSNSNLNLCLHSTKNSNDYLHLRFLSCPFASFVIMWVRWAFKIVMGRDQGGGDFWIFQAKNKVGFGFLLGIYRVFHSQWLRCLQRTIIAAVFVFLKNFDFTYFTIMCVSYTLGDFHYTESWKIFTITEKYKNAKKRFFKWNALYVFKYSQGQLKLFPNDTPHGISFRWMS